MNNTKITLTQIDNNAGNIQYLGKVQMDMNNQKALQVVLEKCKCNSK